MIILIMSFSYVLLHFVAYMTFRKKSILLKTEKGIFYFHFSSFTILALALIIFTITCSRTDGFYMTCAFLSIHGIYSLSFLELWSLSQGSYSLSILKMMPVSDIGDDEKIRVLEKVGDLKFSNRIMAIKRLKLIQEQKHNVSLTILGKVIAKVFLFIAKCANIQDRG